MSQQAGPHPNAQLSPDGKWWWDGQAWQPVPSSAARRRPRALLIGLAAGAGLLVLLISAAVLVGLSGALFFKVTGANSVSEFQQEENYNATYARDIRRIEKDSAPFAPSQSSPGVCNRGGSARGCYETDRAVIADEQALLHDLSSTAVPPRFEKGDAGLKRGLELSITGLTLRNQAIASGNPNASFGPSNAKLDEAAQVLRGAYNEYPADNRPQPPFV